MRHINKENKENKEKLLKLGFTQFPDIYDRMTELNGSNKTVLREIFRHVYENGTGMIYPSWNTMSRNTGLSRSTIYRSLNKLAELELISWERRKNNSSIYNILDIPESLKNKYLSEKKQIIDAINCYRDELNMFFKKDPTSSKIIPELTLKDYAQIKNFVKHWGAGTFQNITKEFFYNWDILKKRWKIDYDYPTVGIIYGYGQYKTITYGPHLGLKKIISQDDIEWFPNFQW